MTALGNKLRQEARSKRILYLIIAALTGVVFWKDHHFEDLQQKEVKVFVVDGNTTYIGPALLATQLTENTNRLAKEAANAIFFRTPEGFPLYEVLLRITGPDVQKQIKDDASKNQEVFVTNKMVQTFVPSREIDQVIVDKDTVDKGIDGDLLRTYVIPGSNHAETSSTAVRVQMRLKRNTEFLTKHEMVVVSLIVKELKGVNETKLSENGR